MPLKHTDVLARKSEVLVSFGAAGDLKAVFNPALITPNVQQAAFAADDTRTPGLREAELLSQVLVSWDYLDSKGKPFPTDVETLRGLPSEVLDRLVGAIFQALSPNPTSVEPSGSFS